MLEIRHLSKTYTTKGAPPVRALCDVSVRLEGTGMVFVLGKSGSGKSTFLNVVGGLDRYDSGEIIIKGKSSSEFAGSDFDSYRNTYLGFIFQEYNLINEFSIGRNIALALELQNRKAEASDVEDILRLVELEGLSERMPTQISGGQRQRVAIARALIKNPQIIMADEPTGALDSATGAAIFQTLKNLSQTRLVLIVSHDREFAERYGDRIIEFSDGRIISDVVKVEATEGTVQAEEESVEARQVEDIIAVSQNAGLTESHIKILTTLLEEKRSEHRKLGKRHAKSIFVDTGEEHFDASKGDQQPFKLIKSRLPQRDAFKMARSSMKHKRLRLFFSIFLSVIAVTLFGFSNVVGTFSVRNLANSVIRDYGYQHVAVNKRITSQKSIFDYNAEASVAFTDSELSKMQSITDGAVARMYDGYWQLGVDHNSKIDLDVNQSYYSYSVRGIVTTTDFDMLGLDVPSVYGRYPQQPNELLITNYTAEAFLIYGMQYVENGMTNYFYPKKINDVISYNISLDGYTSNVFRIVGIVNMPIERYAPLKLYSTKTSASQTLENELYARQSADISFAYTLPTSNIDALLNRDYRNIFEGCAIRYTLPNLTVNTNSENIYYMNPSATSQSFFDKTASYIYLGRDGSMELPKLKKGEIIIDVTEYRRAMDMVGGLFEHRNYWLTRSQLSQFVEESGIFDKKIEATSCSKALYESDVNYDFYHGEYEVVGVVSSERVHQYIHDCHIAIFSDEDAITLSKDSEEQTYFVYLKNQNIAEKFVNSFVGEFDTNTKNVTKTYQLIMAFGSDIFGIASEFKIISLLFFVIALVMCIFSALLVFSFISASVSLKKKEIGILRAIGARRIDVTNIFLWEGGIIGCIILIISLALTFVSIVFFNNYVGALVRIPFTILVMTPLNVLFMTMVCFITIAVASILPTHKVASLKPMDAIRSI